MKSPPKILYFVAEDWAFVSHFQPMAQAATTCGLDVVIATRTHRHAELIVGQWLQARAFGEPARKP